MSVSDFPALPRIDRRRLLTIAAAGAVSAPFAVRAFPSAVFAQESSLAPFFDPATVHTIAAEFDQAAYDAMIQTFRDTKEKQWIEASLTIDGVTYDQVGLRLKGNSSLAGLMTPEEFALPELATPIPVDNERAIVVGDEPAAGEPQRLPWLVRLDEYVKDQAHEGMTEFVIRSNMSDTALNEAVSLDLLTAAGLASQQAAYSRFSTNGSAAVLRLVIENPKKEWMAAHFSETGRLFKSEAEGDWSYKGEDAASYMVAFDLEAGDTGDDAADYAPLIDFLAFLDASDDATFTSELPDRLDIDAFATYLAMMDLIQNHDDISGPGNNSYLYLDMESGQFTIVPWDMNLAFGGLGMNHEGEGRSIVPGGDVVIVGPGDGTPRAFFEFQSPDDGSEGAIVRSGAMSNPLVERFTAHAEWSALVEERTTSLRASLYDSGAAADMLARWVTLLESQASDLVDSAILTDESAHMAAFFTNE